MYSIKKILESRREIFGKEDYIFEKVNGSFLGKTYGEFVDDVYGFASLLQKEGLGGKKIAIFAGNSYAYMVADAAIMGFVGVSVCISKEWSTESLIELAEQIELDAMIYGGGQKEKVDALRLHFKDIKYIPIETVVGHAPTDALTDDLIDPSRCSKIIFSSGTTGIPKAVMLSQNNMFACWKDLCRRAPLDSSDVDYLFLPLHHAYAGICNFLYSMISGMKIYLCSSTAAMLEELQEVKPTVFCAVPLIFERICAACTEKSIEPAAVFGGNIRYMFCGGAWFDPKLREFFASHGVDIMNSCGLSETSSLISLDYPNATALASVGRVMENMTLKIDKPNADGVGEIIVKGENVFMGYYNNPEANAKAFDSDGFFHTGDLGRLDGDILYHCGRIKKVIVLSNGENVYPDEIVALLLGYPELKSAKVYEKDGRICATLFANTRIDPQKIVDSVNSRLPKYSRIQAFETLDDSIGTRMK